MKWNWNTFYNKAYDWILSYGPRILAAILVLFIGMWLIRMLNRFLKSKFKGRNFNPSLRYFLQNLVALTLQILLVLLVMQVAGIQLTFFAAIVAGLSVAAGLALSGTLQNFVSGILILVLKPYRVGDNISTQGQEGTVTSIQLFYTTVLTFDNKTIIIPNGQLSNNVVINLSREGKRRLDIDMKFDYGQDINNLKKILYDSVNSAKDILPDPAARIGVSKMEADKFTITLNLWVNAHGFYDLMMTINEKIINDLKGAGIKLPGM
ncbi:MAG: mechanosensitive ion channel domain-containing protein [Chitinophagaceae bacterium]